MAFLDLDTYIVKVLDPVPYVEYTDPQHSFQEAYIWSLTVNFRDDDAETHEELDGLHGEGGGPAVQPVHASELKHDHH